MRSNRPIGVRWPFEYVYFTASESSVEQNEDVPITAERSYTTVADVASGGVQAGGMPII